MDSTNSAAAPSDTGPGTAKRVVIAAPTRETREWTSSVRSSDKCVYQKQNFEQP
jgi:hypothetical protein